jgi:hypothetical protein
MVPLDDAGAGAPATGQSTSDDVNVLLGKRYELAGAGVEVLCTKAGAGPLTLDGELLSQKGAKPLPSSD